MDRNSFIGLVLIGAILIAYSIYTTPGKEELERQRQVRDSIAQVQQSDEKVEEVVSGAQEEVRDSVINSQPALADSIIDVQRNELYGDFSKAAIGEEKLLTVETEELRLTFSNKGGRIVQAELKNYRRHDSTPLVLFDKAGSVFNLNFFTNNNKNIYTDELYFSASGPEFSLTGENEKQLTYKLSTDDGAKSISFVYTLKGQGFDVGMEVLFDKMDQVIDRRGDEIGLRWINETPSQEKDMTAQRQASTIYYKYTEEDADYISETSDEKEDLVASIKWVAFKQQYFTAALIVDKEFSKYNAIVETKTEENSSRVKSMAASLSIPFSHQAVDAFGMNMYMGPNHFQIFESHEIGLESLIPLGWGIFGWVNEWIVIPIFNFLDNFNLNYGIIILLMTIIIKTALFPITYKTYLSSAKMKVLKPEIKEISEKHKDDAMKKQQATMALYRKAGVNPLAGCVPMLIQMPILFAMFRFFPASIELRQQPFLWADDLSSYDSVLDLPFNIPFYGDHVSLFTLLMAISMVFYTRVNSGQMGLEGGAGGEMAAMQLKIMMYLMPVMMLFFFNSYSSGLSYYYLVANLLSMGQMLAIKNWIIDEDKIHKQIQMNKARPQSAKKSSFQKRLEDMAKKRGMQPKK